MSLYLTLDKGNTSTKLEVWDGWTPVKKDTIRNASAQDVLSAIGGLQITRAIICTVAGEIPGLAEALALKGVTLQQLTADTPLPIRVDYDTPRSLGTDRIAAAVGAYAAYGGRELLVVDIGTAVTYDRVTADGRFIGGNIAPGISLRLRALHTHTAQLPSVSSSGDLPLWGRTTETAMRAGAIYGVAGETAYYARRLPPGGLTVITGGWGRDIAGLLDFDVEVSQSLVSKGLNYILQNQP